MNTGNEKKTMRKITTTLATTALFAVSLNVSAATEVDENHAYYDAPHASTMLLDSFVAKPLQAAMVVGGAATWLVSLPFTLISNSHQEALQKLVIQPANGLQRCLGCTEAENERKVIYDYQRKQYYLSQGLDQYGHPIGQEKPVKHLWDTNP